MISVNIGQYNILIGWIYNFDKKNSFLLVNKYCLSLFLYYRLISNFAKMITT